ncbi:MAG: hypothetical protein IPP42_00975 [Saprospiraceae bacterium]|nr:hypothetical protein [Saprospiraceae bacterium]
MTPLINAGEDISVTIVARNDTKSSLANVTIKRYYSFRGRLQDQFFHHPIRTEWQRTFFKDKPIGRR